MTENEIKQIVEIVTSSIVEPIKEYIDTIVDKKLNEHKISSSNNNLNEEIKNSFKKELFGNTEQVKSASSITDILGESVADLFGDDEQVSNSKQEYYGNPMAEVLDLAKKSDKLNENVVQQEMNSLSNIANQDFSKYLE